MSQTGLYTKSFTEDEIGTEWRSWIWRCVWVLVGTFLLERRSHSSFLCSSFQSHCTISATIQNLLSSIPFFQLFPPQKRVSVFPGPLSVVVAIVVHVELRWRR